MKQNNKAAGHILGQKECFYKDITREMKVYVTYISKLP